MPLFSCSWIIDPAQERAVVSEKNWSLVFMKRKNKIGRGSVTMDKFIDLGGKGSFVESVRFCLFPSEGRSRDLISDSSPKSGINESLFPFPAGMTPHFALIYQDLSQTKHFFVDSALATLHSQNSTFYYCWPAFPCCTSTSPSRGHWEQGIPLLEFLPSYHQLCWEKWADFCTLSLTPCWGRIKYWSYFCCEVWRTKMLSVIWRSSCVLFSALPQDVLLSSKWILWMARGVCCAKCGSTSLFSPLTQGILPISPFSLLHLFQTPPSHIDWQPFLSTLWQFLLHSRRKECTGQIAQPSSAKILSRFSSCQTSLK